MKTHFVDISHWNGTIDWGIASQHQPAFVMKSTEGIGFVDDQFYINKAGCIFYGTPWGNYHFNRPNYDPVDQAKHNIKTVGDGCHVYVIDVETPLIEMLKNTSMACFDETDLKGKAEWSPEITKAMTEVIESVVDEYCVLTKLQNGERPTLAEMVEAYIDYEIANVADVIMWFYSSPYFWKTFMKKSDGTYPNWNDKCKLWEAHYGVAEPMPLPGWNIQSLIAHQYADNLVVPGIPGETDGNWFYGNLDDLQKHFGNGNQTPSPPPIPEKIYINTSSMNVRSEPSDASALTIIGSTTLNKCWYPEAIVMDVKGRYWWKVGKKVYLASWLTRV